mgnify:CR=1 FL=1
MKLYKLFLLMGMLMVMISCNENSKEEKLTLDVSVVDTSIDPAENFYEFANKGWMEANPLPDDESRFGSFDQLAKQTNQKVKELILNLSKKEHEDGSIEQKIGDFYAVGMDVETINQLGSKPIQPYLNEIDKISDINGVIDQAAKMHHMGLGTMFRFSVGPDAKNSEMNIGHFSQGGLGMNDRDYYTSSDKRSKELRKAYIDYITKLFTLTGLEKNEAKKKAETIMQIESRLAHASMTRLERRDPIKTYNKYSPNELKELVDNFDWDGYFNELGVENPGDVNVRQPAFFKEFNAMLAEVPVEDWKTYLKWNITNSASPYLSQDFVEANFDFYGRTFQGSKEMKPRWRRVLNSTNRSLGDAVGQKFVEKHFPPEAKSRMTELVNNLKKALGLRIDQLEWMSEETKQKAHEKLATMNVKIGYPDKWKDYTNLQVGTDSYFENMMNSRKFHREDNLSDLGQPVDKDEWFMNPQTVNAYYSPLMNEICFPAGILQPPFFYMDGDDAINYGAIGAVIGHEMTHGFDDQGRLYDKEGNLTNWWTEDDSKRFEKRSQVLVDQYNQIIVLDTLHADGELSLGENIADLGGLNIAYTGFKMANPDTEGQKVDGYTPEQRFFLAWARVWAQNIRDKEIIRRTKEDVHSLGVNRVNGPVKNMPEFHQAFNVQPGDAMYLPKEEIASIW